MGKCVSWPLPRTAGGGQIQFRRIHEWRRVQHIFVEKYECINTWALHFWYFWLQLPKLCYWKQVCLVTFQEGSFQDYHKVQLVFSWLPLHFFTFHICSEHKSRLSLKAFPYTQHPHILKIHIATIFWPIFSTCDMQQLESKYKALSASRATKILDYI